MADAATIASSLLQQRLSVLDNLSRQTTAIWQRHVDLPSNVPLITSSILHAILIGSYGGRHVDAKRSQS